MSMNLINQSSTIESVVPDQSPIKPDAVASRARHERRGRRSLSGLPRLSQSDSVSREMSALLQLSDTRAEVDFKTKAKKLIESSQLVSKSKVGAPAVVQALIKGVKSAGINIDNNLVATFQESWKEAQKEADALKLSTLSSDEVKNLFTKKLHAVLEGMMEEEKEKFYTTLAPMLQFFCDSIDATLKQQKGVSFLQINHAEQANAMVNRFADLLPWLSLGLLFACYLAIVVTCRQHSSRTNTGDGYSGSKA